MPDKILSPEKDHNRTVPLSVRLTKEDIQTARALFKTYGASYVADVLRLALYDAQKYHKINFNSELEDFEMTDQSKNQPVPVEEAETESGLNTQQTLKPEQAASPRKAEKAAKYVYPPVPRLLRMWLDEYDMSAFNTLSRVYEVPLSQLDIINRMALKDALALRRGEGQSQEGDLPDQGDLYDLINSMTEKLDQLQETIDHLSSQDADSEEDEEEEESSPIDRFLTYAKTLPAEGRDYLRRVLAYPSLNSHKSRRWLWKARQSKPLYREIQENLQTALGSPDSPNFSEKFEAVKAGFLKFIG